MVEYSGTQSVGYSFVKQLIKTVQSYYQTLTGSELKRIKQITFNTAYTSSQSWLSLKNAKYRLSQSSEYDFHYYLNSTDYIGAIANTQQRHLLSDTNT